VACLLMQKSGKRVELVDVFLKFFHLQLRDSCCWWAKRAQNGAKREEKTTQQTVFSEAV